MIMLVLLLLLIMVLMKMLMIPGAAGHGADHNADGDVHHVGTK